MDNNQAVQLLIADTSENSSEAVLTLLEKQGYTCSSQRISRKAELSDALREQSWDVLLLNDEFSEFNAAECADWLEKLKCHTALLLLTQENIDVPMMTRAYQNNIAGMVSMTAPDYLSLVFRRELERCRNRRQCEDLAADNRELNERCRQLLSSSREAVAYIHQGMHIYANESYISKFGFKEIDDITSMPFIDMVSSNSREELKNCLKEVENQWQQVAQKSSQKDQQKHRVTFDIVACKADGKEFNAQLLLEPTCFDGEQCLQVFISTENENQKKLNEAVRQDPETGLFNRQFFLQQFDRLQQSIARKQVAGGMLIYARVSINDRIRAQIGLETADEEMRAFTRLLKQRMNRNNIIARFGDNDFIILLAGDNSKDPVKAEVVAWQNALGNYKFENLDRIHKENSVPSCRLINIPIDEQTGSIKDVLTAVYKELNESAAQDQGPVRRDRISASKTKSLSEMGSIKIELEDRKQGASPVQRDNAVRAETEDAKASFPEMKIELAPAMKNKNIDIDADELTHIINAGRIRLQYEMVIAVADIETEFNEVAITLDDQRYAHITSDDLYGLMDRHPAGPKFDRLVLERTLQVMVDLYKQGQSQQFSVCIGYGSIKDPKFVSWLETQLKKSNLDPSALTINLQQSTALLDVGVSVAFLNQLKESGMKFCISNFTYSDAINNLLKKRHPDYIKLTDSVSSKISNDESFQSEIEELAGSLHDDNIKVIAGGVDDSTTLSAYWVCNIDLVQGKYFQKQSVDLNAASFNENNFVAMRNIA